MDRRESLKLLLLAAATPRRLLADAPTGAREFTADWRDWPDMPWVGPAFWGNRLQDWSLTGGTVTCGVLAPNRTLHCLTRRITSTAGFTTTVSVDPSCLEGQGVEAVAGFRIGVNGRVDDVRSAAVHGTGLSVGIHGGGGLWIDGAPAGDVLVPLDRPLRLECTVTPNGSAATITLRVLDTPAASLRLEVPSHRTLGNVALLSHAPKAVASTGATFADWTIVGPAVVEDPESSYGPIMFAQYTTQRLVTKLTAQLAPIDAVPGVRVWLERGNDEGQWFLVQRAGIDALSRTARFRIGNPGNAGAGRYRVVVEIPLASGVRRFDYELTIALMNPVSRRPLKAAVFSCNADHGFPDDEVVRHVATHRPDLALFLGDQFYEGSGGFGIEHDTVEGSALDMLHKWYMFGWSYREIFRHIPMACIPDDHDVYHGNVWGEGGHAAPIDRGWGAPAQDGGGYKMWPEWVNAVQRCQTSHLPDPVDPAPVDQGIGVYFTRWDYGGVSFAILEDRKFKSAPANVLPAEAQVVNGWIRNPDFDIRAHREIEATLLGDRQMRFLEEWVADWSQSYLKVVLSQTNFAAVHTIPESAPSGEVLPGLPVPEPGAYVEGDKLSVDMDTNGWPAARRDEVVRLLRKASAFHIAGDQHLATMIRYGLDDFRDAGWAFTGPALNNLWPRRWWPPRALRVRPLGEGDHPDYTGDFRDGFDNRVTVLAAANPRRTGLQPPILRDRVTGYGIVSFDPVSGDIRVECWPRHAAPAVGEGGQYAGWPITIPGRGADGRTPLGMLPELRVTGIPDPAVQLLDATGELVYATRVVGGVATLPVYAHGRHTLRVGLPERRQWQERVIEEREWGEGELVFTFG